jgi:hypothetical protein
VGRPCHFELSQNIPHPNWAGEGPYAAACMGFSAARSVIRSTAFCASAAALKISSLSDFSAVSHPSMNRPGFTGE